MTNIVTVKPVRTEADYDEAMARINALLDMNPAPGTPEDDELDVLSTLVEVYEDKHYPTLPLDPVEAIKAAMEEQGMSQKDLLLILGPKSRVSEIINRKRKLTMKEIGALHKNLKIPLEIFFTHSFNMKNVDGYPVIKFHNSNLEFRLGKKMNQPYEGDKWAFIEEAFYEVAEKVNDFMLLNYSTFIKDIYFIYLNLKVEEDNEVRVDEQVTDVILDHKKHPDSKRKSIETAIIDFMRKRPDIPTFFKD